ncbi:hypothetical protein [Marinoscillum sp.]|uniref:hypothetical protein n=1 Tax=Marinoscillum sp. TaxID=2024838 RepID=UPI003BAD7196
MKNKDSKVKMTPSRKYKKVFEDITAEKTSRIKHLKRKVQDAKKQLAEAEAKYESFESKAELFQNLLAQATNRLTVLTSEDNLVSDSSQKVKSLYNTASVSIVTANDTYADTKSLLDNVQKVVEATLAAATEITLAAERIMKRKAANPLISSQLVTDASQAATDANKAVSLIINTLTSTFNALSTANQANNTAEIVQTEIEYLKELIVGADDSSDNQVTPIQSEVKELYLGARDLEKEAQMASDQANQQMVKAKNDLTRATANLSNAESALNAAEAAVGS